MTTCNNETNTGIRLKLVAGKVQSKEMIASVQGTTIEVRNLFFNTPGRRKFIKNRSYEAGLITELVSKYSLGHIDVRFKLIHNKEVVFDTGGLNTTESRLVEIYGDQLKRKFIYIIKKDLKPNINVEAWLALPNFNRNTKNQQTFFINGRLIKSKELNKILEETYHTLIPKGRFAIALIKLEIPSSELDVNVHPAKLEVKITNLDHLYHSLVDLFKPKLWNANIKDHSPLFKETVQFKEEIFVQRDSEDIFQEKIQNEDFLGLGYHQEELPLKETLPPINLIPAPKVEKISVSEPANYYHENLSVTEKNPERKKKIELTPLAQLNNSFILAEDRKGLYIIDQHTCHERILYEKFCREENNKEIFSEYLLIPHSLTLTGQQEGVLLEHILLLKDLGFTVEYFGPRTFVLRAIPAGLKIADLESFFIDLLEILNQSTGLTSAKVKESIITLASCKGAVKANQKLTHEEMLYLIDQLNNVENPHTCPHGRPIIYHLSMEDLYKIFRRGEYRGD